MSDQNRLVIDTQTGRVRRFVGGGRPWPAQLEIVDYHPCRPICVETIEALEHWRQHGDIPAQKRRLPPRPRRIR